MKAVNILKATSNNEMMPRVAAKADSFLCRFCEFKSRCWDIKNDKEQQSGLQPSWK